jgi:hypothetical protein
MSSPQDQRFAQLAQLDYEIFRYLGFTNQEIIHTFTKLTVFRKEQEYFEKYLLT